MYTYINDILIKRKACVLIPESWKQQAEKILIDYDVLLNWAYFLANVLIMIAYIRNIPAVAFLES